MDFLTTLYHELISFLGLDQLLEMYHTGDYRALLTLKGVLAAVSPIIPFILLLEILRAVLYKKFKIEDYKIPFLIFIGNRVIGRFISIAAIAFCIGLFEKYAIFKTSFTWYWLIYGYIIWEFAHFIYHYLAHKVRLFWCLHSTHHAPQSMNLFVSYAHFFLEGPYADVIRTSICILAGVNPPLLFFIMFIDGTWGAFIHVGENVLRDGRLGFLNRIILTPSHHRVHHARNPLYMDTNFCNLLNIWDRAFGTFQPEDPKVVIEYGVTRKINPNSFWDVYFGEIYYLAKDMAKAPGIMNKILYIFMPPGWNHTGDHKTARIIKKQSSPLSPLPAEG
jgi:sterol desaturase/sphingolipid hydroxylase (fatty acid hydroxylase superfamily)